jgi:hypothetical protein
MVCPIFKYTKTLKIVAFAMLAPITGHGQHVPENSHCKNKCQSSAKRPVVAYRRQDEPHRKQVRYTDTSMHKISLVEPNAVDRVLPSTNRETPMTNNIKAWRIPITNPYRLDTTPGMRCLISALIDYSLLIYNQDKNLQNLLPYHEKYFPLSITIISALYREDVRLAGAKR